MVQGFTGMFAGGEVIKGALASFTFDRIEICSYRILIAAAEGLGDTETARVCVRSSMSKRRWRNGSQAISTKSRRKTCAARTPSWPY